MHIVNGIEKFYLSPKVGHRVTLGSLLIAQAFPKLVNKCYTQHVIYNEQSD